MLLLVVVCPLCVSSGVYHRLAKDGGYHRFIPVGRRLVWGWIYRRYCRRCDTSFSLLPDFVLAYMTYGRSLVVWWLWTSLWGIAARCQPFLRKRAVHCPKPVELTSWSDLLDYERSRPGYQLLCRWSQRFSALSRSAIPCLLTTFIALRCHLRLDLADSLRRLQRVPEPLYPLGIALGMWRAILQVSRPDGQTVRLIDALPSLIDFLLGVTSCPSHGLRRASGAPLDYPVESVAGRAPPDVAAGRSQQNGQ